jgi:hypothetical protein
MHYVPVNTITCLGSLNINSVILLALKHNTQVSHWKVRSSTKKENNYLYYNYKYVQKSLLVEKKNCIKMLNIHRRETERNQS